MGQFQNNNVVQSHGIVTEEQNMMIVLEYMSKEDLQKYLLSLQNKYKQKYYHIHALFRV